MAKNHKILVLEASTTSAKAMLFDVDTWTYETASRRYEDCYRDKSLHDPLHTAESVIGLGRKLSEGQDVVAVALVSAWHGLFLSNERSEPLTPVFTWSNRMAKDLCKSLRLDEEFVSKAYGESGCMVHATYPVYKYSQLRMDGLAQDSHLIWDEGMYLNWLLTGDRVQTKCLASGSGLMNIHDRAYSDNALDFAGISAIQLPELIESADELALSVSGADLLGLRPGIPVVASNSDGAMNQVGSGALHDGVMTLSVGTSGAMRFSAGVPDTDPTRSTWCYLSPKTWLNGAATAGATNCIDWFRDKYSPKSQYSELEPDSWDIETPVFLPFLYGERCPGWSDGRRGGFVDLDQESPIASLYQGVREGILFNLKQCFEAVVRIKGIPSGIRLSGGILCSESWVQMCADIFEFPMEIQRARDASLLGGAVLALEQIGAISDVGDFDPPVEAIIAPHESRVRHYREKFAAFEDAYKLGK